MKYINLNNKKLPIPSFFQVYNFGGGNGDKDREIVYAELSDNTPALVNYFYINNEYEHLFQNKIFNDVTNKYTRVGDLYNDIRKMLINKGEFYNKANKTDYDFTKKIFLLDSGAFSIVKYIAKSVNYDIKSFLDVLPSHVDRYYDFANSLKFDLVVGFDLGGKYTEKDGEKDDDSLMNFLSAIDQDEVNNMLIVHTLIYLKKHPNYYPKVLATVHGRTPLAFKENAQFIIDKENELGISFFGFALGGIASSKQLDESWFNGINFKKAGGNKPFKDAVAPAIASKIVRELAGNRLIHALGCGGYPNILLNYFCGATSFDAASPVRRVGDGNEASTKIVFDPTPSKESFSKYFIGGINTDNTLRQEACSYIKLNEVPDNMALCGCKACVAAKDVHNIKYLYSIKNIDGEANYYSRQLIGLHAVNQHKKLCEIISEYDSVDEFCDDYQNKLFNGLKYIYKCIK